MELRANPQSRTVLLEQGVTAQSSIAAAQPQLKGYGFSPFSPAAWTGHKARVGVPGYQRYPQNWLILKTWTGSAFQIVLTNPLFGIYLVILAICIGFFASSEYTPLMKASKVPAQYVGTVNSISIFMLTFFIGQCISKANTRFENVCQTNGCVTRLSALAAASFPPDRARLLMRYTNSIMHIYYLLLSGPMDDSKWSLLQSRGLLTEEEIKALQLQGSPAVVLYSWAVKGLLLESYSGGRAERTHATMPERVFLELVQAMEQNIGACRGLSAKQIGYTLYQIPSTYFHIVYVAVNAFLLCTVLDTGHHVAAALSGPCADAAGDICVPGVVMAIVTELFLIVIFLGLLFTAEECADTYGDNIIDYDLGFDLDALWQESQNVLKSMNVQCPSLPSTPALSP